MLLHNFYIFFILFYLLSTYSQFSIIPLMLVSMDYLKHFIQMIHSNTHRLSYTEATFVAPPTQSEKGARNGSVKMIR